MSERRRCKGCRAFLRSTNTDDLCSPCDLSEIERLRERERREDANRTAEQLALKVEQERLMKVGLSKERLIADMLGWIEEHGRVPSKTEWEDPAVRGTGLRAYATYVNWFGSWAEAVRATGHEPRQATVDRSAIIQSSDRVQGFRRPYLSALPGTAADIARVIGKSPKEARHSLYRLEKAGFVRRERRDKRTVWYATDPVSEKEAA